jgi:hypothetical protein
MQRISEEEAWIVANEMCKAVDTYHRDHKDLRVLAVLQALDIIRMRLADAVLESEWTP